MDWGGAYGSRVPVEELDKLAVLAKVSTRPRAVARKSYPSYGQHVPVEMFDQYTIQPYLSRPSNCRELTKKEKQTERELSPPQFVNTADAFGIRISRRKKVDEEREDQRRRDAEERIRAAMAPSTVAAPDSDTPAQRTYLGNFERALDISEPITVQPPRPQFHQIILPDVDSEKKEAQKKFRNSHR
ncbi:hypothetical protein QR680_018858 [Steinernema hermaphroditum]|uniref:Uncharacterized protein n=1 Tax=Steinernema hermaphroditum TaxID=289476 RepID=A0AA39HKI6_9BILA|nr:hypothetical protein QR680_018858 [Steinernema hermaphroditum]